MTTTYYTNVFHDIFPAPDKFTNPPCVRCGSLLYVVELYWDLALLEKKTSADAFQMLKADGVVAQAKLLDSDGDVHYAKQFDNRVEVTRTELKSRKPSSELFIRKEEDDMHPLDKLKFQITEAYPEEQQGEIKAGLETCRSLADIHEYFQDDGFMEEQLMSFFSQV